MGALQPCRSNDFCQFSHAGQRAESLLRVCEKMGQARSLMLFIQGFLDFDDEPVPFFHKVSDVDLRCLSFDLFETHKGTVSGAGARLLSLLPVSTAFEI